MDTQFRFDMVSNIMDNGFVGNSRNLFRITQSLLLGVASLGNPMI